MSTGSKEKEAKLKALNLAVDKLEKTYGKGAVMKLGDKQVVAVDTISTGSLGLDIALGTGGLPRGRIVEIYGPESSCLLYTSPSPRDRTRSRMPSSA